MFQVSVEYIRHQLWRIVNYMLLQRREYLWNIPFFIFHRVLIKIKKSHTNLKWFKLKHLQQFLMANIQTYDKFYSFFIGKGVKRKEIRKQLIPF